MTLPLDNLIRLKQNPSLSYIYDVDLNNIPALRAYDSVEVHLVLYPFSRQITANKYIFNPFQEYSEDLATRRHSLYSRVPQPANSIFGIFLGVFIVLVFLALQSSELYSLQSIIAILGAYFIGKDLWNDIESAMVKVSQHWRLRYQTAYYAYQVERNTTLTNYSAYARERRFGKGSLLPTYMEFISNSNSKTIRMKFTARDLRDYQDELAHILAIRLDPAVAQLFAEGGYMFSVKVTLNERLLLLRRAHEYFQSLNAGERGCLNFDNEWTPQAALAREALFFGNLRYMEGKRMDDTVKMVTNDQAT